MKMHNINPNNENYMEATEILKKLNDELFYDDLKSRMENNLNENKKYYSDVIEALEKMSQTINRMPIAINEKVDEFNVVKQEFLDVIDKVDCNIMEQYESFWVKVNEEMTTKLDNNKEAYEELIASFRHASASSLLCIEKVDKQIVYRERRLMRGMAVLIVGMLIIILLEICRYLPM